MLQTAREPLFRVKKNRSVEAPAPLAPLADTHGHLTAFRKLSPAEAVARVRDDAAALLKEAEATEACALLDELHFVAGVHPYGARKLMEDVGVLRRLESLLEDPRCVGVGEFGLDVGPWSELGLEEQVPALRLQLRMAHERAMPVELHVRDGEGPLATAAHDRSLEVLLEEGVPAAGCDLHCFTSGPEVMTPFVELGCRIAFGGASTFGRSEGIRAAALTCPEHLLLSETDSPYMAPVPLRGQECEPAMVAFTVENLARVREESAGVPRQRTYDALWHNALAFFGLE